MQMETINNWIANYGTQFRLGVVAEGAHHYYVTIRVTITIFVIAASLNFLTRFRAPSMMLIVFISVLMSCCLLDFTLTQ